MLEDEELPVLPLPSWGQPLAMSFELPGVVDVPGVVDEPGVVALGVLSLEAPGVAAAEGVSVVVLGVDCAKAAWVAITPPTPAMPRSETPAAPMSKRRWTASLSAMVDSPFLRSIMEARLASQRQMRGLLESF